MQEKKPQYFLRRAYIVCPSFFFLLRSLYMCNARDVLSNVKTKRKKRREREKGRKRAREREKEKEKRKIDGSKPRLCEKTKKTPRQLIVKKTIWQYTCIYLHFSDIQGNLRTQFHSTKQYWSDKFLPLFMTANSRSLEIGKHHIDVLNLFIFLSFR